MSKTKKFFIALGVLNFAALLLLLIAAEVIVRMRGVRPYTPPEFKLTVEPDGRLFGHSSTLGYVNLPGRRRVIHPDGHAATIQVNEDSTRITRPPGSALAGDDAAKVWLLGCSYTFGSLALNDEDTFPYLLQKGMTDLDIVNFGTNGYGTLQSYLQFKEALAARPKPALAIYMYALFHAPRNTGLRGRQKAVAPWGFLSDDAGMHMARFTPAGDLKISDGPVHYREFPLMRVSAFSHFLELNYNRLEEQSHQSVQVTFVLIQKLAAAAREAGVPFVVAGIVADAFMLPALAERGIPVADVAVDLTRPGNLTAQDAHPSLAANREYVRKLGPVIRRQLK